MARNENTSEIMNQAAELRQPERKLRGPASRALGIEPNTILVLRKQELYCGLCGSQLVRITKKSTKTNFMFFRYWCTDAKCNQWKRSVDLHARALTGEFE